MSSDIGLYTVIYFMQFVK